MRWSQSAATINNFGDAINPDLFYKITGLEAVNYKNVFQLLTPQVYLFIGSNLDGIRIKNSVICGAGFKSEESKLKVKPVKIVAVRGPLTKKKLQENGVECPDIFCDPGLLVSDFYPQKGIQKKFDIGIIPHYVDKDIISQLEILDNGLTYKILDIESPRDEFLRSVNECHFIASSSLHGIITAHSYQIPAMWIKMSDKIIGGEFKFQDYYQSLNVFDEHPHFIQRYLELDYVKKNAKCYPCEINKTKFLEALTTHINNRHKN